MHVIMTRKSRPGQSSNKCNSLPAPDSALYRCQAVLIIIYYHAVVTVAASDAREINFVYGLTVGSHCNTRLQTRLLIRRLVSVTLSVHCRAQH